MRRFHQLWPGMVIMSSALLIPGCMTAPGYGPVGAWPGNGYPAGWGPMPGNVPVSGPGGGYPTTGYIPPGTGPSSPFVPISNPTTPDNPPIVVGSPPKPTTPSEPATPSAPTDPASFWTPWPLPPRNRSSAAARPRSRCWTPPSSSPKKQRTWSGAGVSRRRFVLSGHH